MVNFCIGWNLGAGAIAMGSRPYGAAGWVVHCTATCAGGRYRGVHSVCVSLPMSLAGPEKRRAIITSVPKKDQAHSTLMHIFGQ